MRHIKTRPSPGTCASLITIDSYANGLSMSRRSYSDRPDSSTWQDLLGLDSEPRQTGLKSRYALGREQSRQELENQFRGLALRGVLQRSVVVMGVETDPFHPFDSKFNASMTLLELLGRYSPGRVIIQTRSPLIVIGLPILKALRCALSVSVGIETSSEEEARKWTPDLPQVEDRVKLMKSLKRFGIHTGAHVSPLLPYGDWERDSGKFADLLVENSDYVLVRSLESQVQRHGRGSFEARVARKLADSRRFHWLRNDAAKPLLQALEQRSASGGLIIEPDLAEMPEKQLRLFE